MMVMFYFSRGIFRSSYFFFLYRGVPARRVSVGNGRALIEQHDRGKRLCSLLYLNSCLHLTRVSISLPTRCLQASCTLTDFFFRYSVLIFRMCAPVYAYLFFSKRGHEKAKQKPRLREANDKPDWKKKNGKQATGGEPGEFVSSARELVDV